MYPRIDLDPKRKKNFERHKHPWIFSGAIVNLSKSKEELNGKVVSAYCDDEFVMHGYYNQLSQIAIRALSWQEEDKINEKFLIAQIKRAIELRQKFVLTAKTTACRLIFAESDFLPGFVLDKYNDSYILQIHTLGAENLKKLFVKALVEATRETFGQEPTMVLEKSDISSRKHEGMGAQHHELLFGTKVSSEVILENNHKFEVDFDLGQKTGFFLDQRENRLAVSKYTNNKRILNLFAYTGGFSIYAAKAGAKKIDSVDSSKTAIELMSKNFELNKIETPHKEMLSDAFDFLSALEPNQYDLIVVDPPAFIKSVKRMEDGMKGYLSLNQLALQKLPNHGILVTSSCSAALNDVAFFRMLNWAANAAKCQIQVIEKKCQPADHPLTPYFPEGEYLKFYIVRKVMI